MFVAKSQASSGQQAQLSTTAAISQSNLSTPQILTPTSSFSSPKKPCMQSMMLVGVVFPLSQAPSPPLPSRVSGSDRSQKGSYMVKRRPHLWQCTVDCNCPQNRSVMGLLSTRRYLSHMRAALAASASLASVFSSVYCGFCLMRFCKSKRRKFQPSAAGPTASFAMQGISLLVEVNL